MDTAANTRTQAERLAAIHYDGDVAAADFIATNGQPDRQPSDFAKLVSRSIAAMTPRARPALG